ncbi:MAG: hypothetical protein HUJ96_08545 [Marinilabiliaceae bacterium]|nr:hypothetical protein [Marinilabiliaceae bacterium]
MANWISNFRRWVGNSLNHLGHTGKCSLSLSPLKEMKSILILSTAEDSMHIDAMNVMRTKLMKLCPSAKVTALLYYTKQKNEEAHISAGDIQYYTNEEFSFFFKIKSDVIIDCFSNEYDVIIVSETTYNKYIDFILPYLRSVLKIGSQSAYCDKLNIMINSNASDISQFNTDTLNTFEMLFNKH